MVILGVLDGRYVNASGDSMNGVLTLLNNGLRLLDTNASHTLTVMPGSDLSSHRILTITKVWTILTLTI